MSILLVRSRQTHASLACSGVFACTGVSALGYSFLFSAGENQIHALFFCLLRVFMFYILPALFVFVFRVVLSFFWCLPVSWNKIVRIGVHLWWMFVVVSHRVCLYLIVQTRAGTIGSNLCSGIGTLAILFEFLCSSVRVLRLKNKRAS